MVNQNEIRPEVVERYQKLYEQDPASKVFAPLSEAYRKMGMIKEAFQVATNGVKRHPDFAGGRVALARVLLDQSEWDKALPELKRVVDLAPENVLGHSLLAECYLRLKRPKDALKAFKMLLFLSPDNDKAQMAVKKLESLTADEYAPEVFALKPISQAVREWDDFTLEETTNAKNQEQHRLKTLERMISLADAYIVRNDHDRAIETLNEAERQFGPQNEIVKRLKIIHQRSLETIAVPVNKVDLEPVPAREMQEVDQQIALLRQVLKTIRSTKSSE